MTDHLITQWRSLSLWKCWGSFLKVPGLWQFEVNNTHYLPQLILLSFVRLSVWAMGAVTTSVSRGTVSTLFSNVCHSTLNLINKFKQRDRAMPNTQYIYIDVCVCVRDLVLQGKTLCYEYEWNDIHLPVIMRVGVCVNGPECEPPAVLVQAQTYIQH